MATAIFKVPWMMTDRWVKRTIGKFVNEADHVRKVFRGAAVNVLQPNGQLLFALRPGLVPATLTAKALPALRHAAKFTNRRPVAAGGQDNFRSGTLGFFHNKVTYATWSNRLNWDTIQPLLRCLNRALRAECPEQHETLRRAAERTPAERLIPHTVLSNAAVNLNARCAVHMDDDNLPGSFGVMTAIRAGEFSGGWLVFPRFRVAVDLQDGDCLICNNRQAHGNTALVGEGFERVSVVAYFHASNLPV